MSEGSRRTTHDRGSKYVHRYVYPGLNMAYLEACARPSRSPNVTLAFCRFHTDKILRITTQSQYGTVLCMLCACAHMMCKRKYFEAGTTSKYELSACSVWGYRELSPRSQGYQNRPLA